MKAIPCILAIMLAAAPAGAAEDAKKSFETLWRAELNKVRATTSHADDLALARKMLQAAKDRKLQPKMVARLCDYAYYLSRRSKEGRKVAIEAMKLEAAKVSERKEYCLKRIASLEGRAKPRSRPAPKTTRAPTPAELQAARQAAIAKSIEKHLGHAEEQQRDGNYAQAARAARAAMAVAYVNDSPRVPAIRRLLKRLAAMEAAGGRAETLKARLKAKPADHRTRDRIIRIYLVELDRPDEAGKFVSEDDDEMLLTYIPLAAGSIEKVGETGCYELGEWYVSLAKNAPYAGRTAMLKRAARYYQRFIELHTGDDEAVGKVRQKLRHVAARLEETGEALAAGADKQPEPKK